jgi:hypothetical protein
MNRALIGYPERRRVVSVPDVAGVRCFTAVMPRDNPATALAACAGCAASWRGGGRALPGVSRVLLQTRDDDDRHGRIRGP